MFGPVIIASLESFLSRYVSFCTKLPDGNIFSITGWRPSFISITPLLSETNFTVALLSEYLIYLCGNKLLV